MRSAPVFGEDPEHVAEVSLRIELVQTRRGDQREQIAGGLAVIVAADEQPRGPAGGDL